MKTIAIIMILAFTNHVLAQVTAGPVRPLSPEIINPENGHIYLLLSQGDWTDSEAEAVALGGHLATIRNQSEEDWVYAIFSGYGAQWHNLWIGLHDVKPPNHFVWASGARLHYTDWFPGEPVELNGLQPYVAITYFYAAPSTWYCWGDTETDFLNFPFNGVVEIIPANRHLLRGD
jgi:hypothetical protein